MTNNELPNQDYIEQWSEDGISQLYDFMQSFQPNFQTTRKNDFFILAQEYQHTIDTEQNPDFRNIMGLDGESTLNKVASQQITFRRLALITDRLFILSKFDDARIITDDYDRTALITGLFDSFAFSQLDDKDLLSVELIEPQFLRPRLDIKSETIAAADRVIVPVGSISARIYDPEELFQ